MIQRGKILKLGIGGRITQAIRIILSATNRFYWDDCFSRASSLAYTTLFALVPVFALSMGMFNLFNVGEEQVKEITRTIIEKYLPPIENDQLRDLQDQVYTSLIIFTKNVSVLNTLSVAILIVSGIALVNTIESALNVVWRVTSNLSVVSKIISFWAVITLTPLMIAVSFYWYGQFGAYASGEMLNQYKVFVSLSNFLIPLFATWIGLCLLYYKIPAAPVSFKDALFGSFIAAVLFELVKRAFAYYITLSTTYSKLYGVVASIPLFLFWLYVVWIVVLLGAEICYQAGSIEILKNRRKYATDFGEIGAILGIRILCTIAKNHLSGNPPPTEGQIAIETGADPQLVRTCLNILSEADVITEANNQSHTRVLICAPDKLSLREVFKTFRSKSHLSSTSDENALLEQDTEFLELIKKVSLGTNFETKIGDWTLSDLVKASV